MQASIGVWPRRAILDATPHIYSPSQTEVWNKCPVLRQLEREGWRPLAYGRKEIAAAMGRGLAAGLGIFYQIRRGDTDPLPPGATPQHLASIAADNAYQAELADLTKAGRYCDNRDVELLDAARPKLQRVITKVLAADPIPPDWTIEDIELTLSDHGYARLDLGVKDPHQLAVVDWKLKLNLPKGWKREQFLRECAHNHRMLHYAWAYSQVKQAPVTRYYMGLIVLEPTFDVQLIPYEIDPEHYQAWLTSAQQKWADMAAEEAGTRVPYQAAEHFDRYGACPMYAACFTHKYDEGLMRNAYTKGK